MEPGFLFSLLKSGNTQKQIQIHFILMLDHNSVNLNVIILQVTRHKTLKYSNLDLSGTEILN